MMTPLNRAVVKISGDDAASFLQGLLTNDIHKVTDNIAIYSCILSPQGKYLHDLFICRWQDAFFLECDRSKAPELIRKLSMYKLRAKVTIEDVSSDYSIFALTEACDIAGTKLYADPRHPAMGYRLIAAAGSLHGFSEDAEAYDLRRLTIGIPEGEKDLLSGEAFPLEYGFDRLQAIDYQKGCYVGQEVTARTTYRGIVRKKIYKVTATSPLPAYDTDINAGDSKIGVMRSSHGGIGLALIREEDYTQASATGHHPQAGGIAVTLVLPE